MRVATTWGAASILALSACAADATPVADDAPNSAALGQGDDNQGENDDRGGKAPRIEHVMLLSIDGMHQVDLERYLAAHPDSALAKLNAHGVQYQNAYVNRLDGTPSNPSDSFPGLLALTTGGSSPTHGGWYDVSYARDLYPYNASAPCSDPPGTSVTYDESIEQDGSTLTSLWGSTTDDKPTHDPVVVRSRLDPTKLPYAKSKSGCTPVFPHQYLRVNTMFEVAHEAGLHTAWSDKHPAYELVTGPSGAGLDDFFAPEINSVATNLVPAAPSGDDYTTAPSETEVYDDFKVQALLNQIDGQWSDHGLAGATDTSGRAPGVPAIFGMNFQAVSVAQKNARTPNGGYASADGTPGSELADALAHTDASLARLVAALDSHHLTNSTLIIVTAKHGQSPIDKSRVQRVDGDAVATLVNTAAPVAGHIEDDVALYWLKSSNGAAAAATALQHPTSTVDPKVARVFTTADQDFARMFGDPRHDPRVPDVVVQPVAGVIYSLSTKKLAEHGGFADDDSHVALLVSHPQLHAQLEAAAVRTKQVAPTILKALGLSPNALDAVRKEHTPVLPNLGL